MAKGLIRKHPEGYTLSDPGILFDSGIGNSPRPGVPAAPSATDAASDSGIGTRPAMLDSDCGIRTTLDGEPVPARDDEARDEAQAPQDEGQGRQHDAGDELDTTAVEVGYEDAQDEWQSP